MTSVKTCLFIILNKDTDQCLNKDGNIAHIDIWPCIFGLPNAKISFNNIVHIAVSI